MENREKEKKHYRTQIFAEKPGFKNLINLRSSASKKSWNFSIFPLPPFSFVTLNKLLEIIVLEMNL
jgi:hypothetical protein